MQWKLRMLLVAAAVVTGGSGWAPPWFEKLASVPARVVDPALADQTFGLWLSNIFESHALMHLRHELHLGHCDGDRPNCRIFAIEIPSRARTVALTFDVETNAFLGGFVGGPELERVQMRSLAEMEHRLTQAIRPYPLDCPGDTTLRLREEHAGLIEWCEDGAGVKQGPARAWFSTGRYLMHRGGYQDGERDGSWFECDRFERCKRTRYVEGVQAPPQRGE